MTQIRVIPAELCLFLGRRGIRSLTLHSELTAAGYRKHDLKPGVEPKAGFDVNDLRILQPPRPVGGQSIKQHERINGGPGK